MKHNMVKNPNWQDANQLAIYEHWAVITQDCRETNPWSVQSGIRTQDLRTASASEKNC